MYRFHETDKTPIIDLGNGNLVKLEREELDEKTKEKAVRELRETDEIKKAALKEFSLLLSGKLISRAMDYFIACPQFEL